MTLSADILSALPELRAEAEARMLDTCDIGRFIESVDPVTFETIETLTDAQYAGKCRISSASNAVSEKNAAGQSLADESFILSVPVAGATQIRTDATLKITAVDLVSGNPAMVGRKFRVAGLASVSQATAARYSLELSS